MRSFSALLAVVAIAAAACSSSNKTAAKNETTTTRANANANVAVYEKPGPYKVGFTTLHLNDREVVVWYPADDIAVTGKPKASYSLTTPLPQNLKGLVPAQYNRTIAMDAYADVAGSSKGPFPVVLFGHGAGGFDLANSALDVGIASWGFVVASTDYIEYDIVATATNRPSSKDPHQGDRAMLRSLDLLTSENTRDGSPLHGIVDASRVATSGHSLGGLAAFNALNDPRVKVAVGWAPVGPSGPVPAKPTMIIGAGGDSAVTPAELTKLYGELPAPKRRIEIGGTTAGHNTFTDVCTVIREGGGLIAFAKQIHAITDETAKLAENGCASSDLDPVQFWPIVQHFTVAEIRSALGIDPQPVGLGDGVTAAFGHIPVTYEHTP